MKMRHLLEQIKKHKGNLLLCIVALYTGCIYSAALFVLNLEKDRIPPPNYLKTLIDIEPVTAIKTSINQANQELLERLPGIGPAIAQRIIDYRKQHGPFTELEQIMNVKGIGKEKYAELKYFIEL